MNALQQYDLDRLAHAEHLIGINEAGRGCLAGSVEERAGHCRIPLPTTRCFKMRPRLKLSSMAPPKTISLCP